MYTWMGRFDQPLEPLVRLIEDKLLTGVERQGQWSTHLDSHVVESLLKPLVSNFFQGTWRYCMVNVLFPMSVLHPHLDSKLPDGCHRRHLVIQTNEYAWCFHNGQAQQLVQGNIYELDPSIEHYAVNLGTEPRIHLIGDIT